jgi:hypothetical protein
MLAAMAHCPNCEAEVAIDAAKCAGCGAVFNGTDWKPLDRPQATPSRRTRILKAAAKAVIVLFSLAWLFLGGSFAWSEHSAYPNAIRWFYANVAAAVPVIVIAIFARTTWSGVALFACIALGFTSCANNFHLNLR